MLRRHATVALMGAAILPVLNSGSRAQVAAAGAAMELRQKVLAASTFSTNTSQLAIASGENPAVKTFARFEAAEQQATLRAMQLAGLTIPQTVPLDSDQSQMLQQLRGLKGSEFDRMYVRGQLLGHQELLTLHQRMLTAGTREEQIISTLSVASIEQHISMLQAMQLQG
jgi:putative membrane protein